MVKVLVLYYSMYGHLEQMAKAVAKGAQQVENATVDIKRIPETLSEEILGKMGAKPYQGPHTVATPDDLANYDAIIVGTPTRFGNVPSQVSSFFDQTGGLWAKGALVGKVGGAFVGSATQHGGQESTVFNLVKYFFHHGLVIVGLPYAFGGQSGVEEVKGCSPYGASTIAGGDGSRLPSKIELEGAEFQGKHIATIARAIADKQ